MQERQDATHLALLGGVWVLVGASVGLLSHRLWLDSRDRELQPGRLAASWHAATLAVWQSADVRRP